MKRFDLSPARHWYGIAVVLGSLVGCAATPRPKALDDASALLTHSDAAEIAALKPALVEEANRYLRQANEAYQAGDAKEAALYAQMAINRYQTARNLVQATSARKLAELTDDRAGHQDARRLLELRQEELRRFATLEQRIGDIHQQLERKPEGDAPEVVAAKQALLEARRRQADAIGAGAPAKAPQSYQQGSSLIGTAVESLALGVYDESRRASTEALAAFERAMAEAGQAATQVAGDASGRQAAEAAILDAAEARALAIAAGQPSSNAEAYQRGSALLESAENRRARGDHAGATRSARDAERAFKAPLVAPVVPTPSYDARSTEQILVALRFKRAELLGKGANDTCGPSFREFEAIVDLAKDRLAAGDGVQAREFAIRAEERIRACEAPVSLAVRPNLEADAAQAVDRVERQRATASIQRAQTELAKARARFGEDPRLNQAATLVQQAEKWLDRSSYPQAEQLADQAVLALASLAAAPPAPQDLPIADPVREAAALALQRAQTAHAKLIALNIDPSRLRQPELLLSSAESWFDRGRFDQARDSATKALEAFAALERSATQPAATPPASPAAVEARRAIERAEDARVKAIVALVPDAELKTPDRLLELARAANEEARYQPASLYASKAADEYLARTQKTAKGAPADPTTVTAPSEPAKAPPTTDVEVSCSDAKSKIFHANRLRKKVGGPHLDPTESAAFERGSALATIAETRVGQGDCTKAYELADESVQVLMVLPLRPAERNTSPKPQASKADQTKKTSSTTPGDLPSGSSKASEGDAAWRDAYAKVTAALQRRDEAKEVLQGPMMGTYERGLAALAESRAAYEAKRYREAMIQADLALAQFDAVLASSGHPVASDARRRQDPPAAARRTPRQPSSAGMPATSAQPGSATNSPWSDPYRVVYRALKLRDRARASAKTSDDQATVARGSAKLDDAREAWSDRKYDAAEQFARAAIADFRTVIDQAEAEPKSDGEPKRSAEELARAADAALREAKVTLQVCERDKCEERDFAELTRARELIKSADEASKAGRHAYAEELAGQARDKLTAILAKPRPKAPAPKEVDPEAKRKAEDGMREAEIAKKLCESRSCSAIDLEAWLRAQQNLAAAQSAIADGDPERALRLSEQAREGFTAIVKPTPQKPAFVIPSEVQRVSRSGSQLYLDPPIDFRTGSVALDAESQPTIEQLAKVLAANKDLVKRVRIVGFTDNRGNQALNKSLSAARAEAVRKALAGLGVDAASMVSEGRGSESPIADNATAEGRKANRRVEIQLELQ